MTVKSLKPFGQILKEAGLINDHQIQVVLFDQAASGLRFGEILVLRGWLKRETLEYFLAHVDRLRPTPAYLEGGIPLEQCQTGERLVYRISMTARITGSHRITGPKEILFNDDTPEQNYSIQPFQHSA